MNAMGGTAAFTLALFLARPAPARAIDETLPSWQPGAAGDLAFNASPFMKRMAFPKPDKASKDFDPDGAYGSVDRAWDRTHSGAWYIEEQRYGFDALLAGLAYGRQDLVQRAETIFDWGFRQQRTDGSFPCGDAYHSASFFVEAAAHAALLLQASGMADANRAWVDAVKPKLGLAAAWMMDPAHEVPGRRKDAPYTHRNYLDAAALGECGVLLGDSSMVARSKEYMEQGLARQDPSGFNPEKGGWDTSYHCVGLLYALYYYSLVADAQGREDLDPMIDKGLAWLKGRMRADGSVDQAGNTRSGAGQELGRNGKPKTMSYASAWRCAYYWAMITQDPSFIDMAKSLHQAGEKEAKRHRP
jgi:hypothetical protein